MPAVLSGCPPSHSWPHAHSRAHLSPDLVSGSFMLLTRWAAWHWRSPRHLPLHAHAPPPDKPPWTRREYQKGMFSVWAKDVCPGARVGLEGKPQPHGAVFAIIHPLPQARPGPRRAGSVTTACSTPRWATSHLPWPRGFRCLWRRPAAEALRAREHGGHKSPHPRNLRS